ncbi:hypothetical protein EJ03DRAFT_374981, partial [Teratosphaeria nubilosa]
MRLIDMQVGDLTLYRDSTQLQRDALCKIGRTSSSGCPRSGREACKAQAFTPNLTGRASCMDLRQHDHINANEHTQIRADHHLRFRRQLPTVPRLEAHSTPLPQTQWSEIPLPYRPRDWVEPQYQHHSLEFDARRQTAPVASDHDAAGLADIPAPLRPRRITRGVSLRHSPGSGGSKVDFARLYPAVGPYDDVRPSPCSVSDDLQSRIRSVRQPLYPDYRQIEPRSVPPYFGQVCPRSPTYPPAGQLRTHRAFGAGDAAFEDEEEFRLFVQATVGLSPELSQRPQTTYSSWSPTLTQRSTSDGLSSTECRRQRDEQVFSPTTDTLSPATARALQELSLIPYSARRTTARQDTMIAYQQVPTMPEMLQPQQPHCQQQEYVPQYQEQREQQQLPRRRPTLQTMASAPNLWLQLPDAVPESPPRVSPIDVDDYASFAPPSPLTDDDDELPDYAASQAQALARQRVDAARRAQELHRRWRESGGARR